MIVADLGLGLLLVLLAMVMIWRLADLFRPQGRWTEERSQELASEVRG